MCGSMVDIQSTAGEIRRGKKEERRRKKSQGKNIMVCPITYGNHKQLGADATVVARPPRWAVVWNQICGISASWRSHYHSRRRRTSPRITPEQIRRCRVGVASSWQRVRMLADDCGRCVAGLRSTAGASLTRNPLRASADRSTWPCAMVPTTWGNFFVCCSISIVSLSDVAQWR